MTPNSTSPPDPYEVLARAQSSRQVIQGFTPLAESLEWTLGTQYLATRGSRAFLTDPVPVPYAVNNSGALSRQAADVLLAALTAAEEAGEPVGEIRVLEVGIGLGLFARYFLDAFRERCRETGRDDYDRLTYVAADSSEQMLLDAVRHGTFQHHPGRYCLRVIDALDPAALRDDPALAAPDGRPFVAVFLNYLLDCLPAAVIRAVPLPPTHAGAAAGAGLSQLCVRTCIARGVNLHDYTDHTPDDLTRLAASTDRADRQRLLEFFGLFTTDYDFQPVRPEGIPRAETILDLVHRATTPVVHSHGAVRCLEGLLDLLRPHGVILVNDYGPLDGSAGDQFEHQRYTGSTFIGVNFAQLKAHFSGPGGGEAPGNEPSRWAEPAEGTDRIHSRLIGHCLAPGVVDTFRERFGKAAWDRLEEPVVRAKTLAAQGRVEAAATAYHHALRRQPWNWLLLLDAANFLTFTFGDAAAGADVARAGLALNPCCSAELWNAYGDALFSQGRVADSHAPFLRALAVNPDGVQARYNLAWVHLHRREHAEALAVIAEALVRDRRGEYRDRLLQKQSEVLADLARRAQREAHTLINRVSLYPRADGATSAAPPGRTP